MGYHNHYKDTDFSRGYMSTGKSAAVLKELGDNILAAAKAALAKGADDIVKDAKARCPERTGALNASIRAVPNKTGTAIKIRADAQAKDGVFYGQIVEFSPKINRPFLYPAFDAQRNQIKDSIIDAIKGALRK